MYDISSCLGSSPKASKMLDVSGLDAVLIFGLHEEPAVRGYAQQALDARC
jgi:hypothetical protein